MKIYKKGVKNMNYYPNNYYPSYPYGNMYSQYNQQQMQPMVQPPVTAQTQAAAAPQLQGKIVDSEEMVKATEVPFGGYGIFPTADLSKVYIKTWNNNGTTQITSYQPVTVEKTTEEDKKVDTTSLILESINEIEAKIDCIVSTKSSADKKDDRKEIKTNAF